MLFKTRFEEIKTKPVAGNIDHRQSPVFLFYFKVPPRGLICVTPGGTAHDLAGLGGFWRAFFQESPEINGSNGTAHDCPCHTEINGNLRILNEITGKLVTLNIKI